MIASYSSSDLSIFFHGLRGWETSNTSFYDILAWYISNKKMNDFKFQMQICLVSRYDLFIYVHVAYEVLRDGGLQRIHFFLVKIFTFSRHVFLSYFKGYDTSLILYQKVCRKLFHPANHLQLHKNWDQEPECCFPFN